jgi:hypothetical protein
VAVLWTYFYGILLVVHPGTLTIGGTPISGATVSTLIYFSVATLTSTGMTDILPLPPIARMLCSLEMIASGSSERESFEYSRGSNKLTSIVERLARERERLAVG